MLFVLVVAILSLAAIWGIVHAARTISDQIRFRNLMVWLEMDRIAVDNRLKNKDIDGLLRDMAMKLRERSHLFLFKVERTIRALISEGHLGEEHTESMWPLIEHMRSMLENTDPFGVPQLVIDELDEGLPEEACKRLEPLIQESKLLSRKCDFFFAWIRRGGSFRPRSKGTE
jgi:hypothetical protein